MHGAFGYPYLDHYWTEPGCYPFLVKRSDRFAGFALINTHYMLPDSEYSLAEFFVLKRYRRQGLGRALALHVFEQFHGTWEIRQLPGNVRAISFWKRIVGDYTAGAFTEIIDGYGEWKGPILQFTNGESKSLS